MLRKDNIQDQVVTVIQRNENIVLEMNTGNNEMENALKQSSNCCMKTPAKENEYIKLENSQPQIENLHYMNNKIKIDEMK